MHPGCSKISFAGHTDGRPLTAASSSSFSMSPTVLPTVRLSILS